MIEADGTQFCSVRQPTVMPPDQAPKSKRTMTLAEWKADAAEANRRAFGDGSKPGYVSDKRQNTPEEIEAQRQKALAVVDYIKENGGRVSISDIAAGMGHNRAHVKNLLQVIAAMGVLEKEAVRRATLYSIKEGTRIDVNV